MQFKLLGTYTRRPLDTSSTAAQADKNKANYIVVNFCQKKKKKRSNCSPTVLISDKSSTLNGPAHSPFARDHLKTKCLCLKFATRALSIETLALASIFHTPQRSKKSPGSQFFHIYS